MEKIKKTTRFLYEHNFVRYLVVGGSTFAIDFFLLFVLHGRLHLNLELATSIAYWASIAYNFTLNRSWTFSAADKRNLHKHLAPYLALLACNYLFTVIFVSLASHSVNYLVAKAISVIVQTAWTYRIYKRYIFL